jgi:hypothetical protein
LSAPCRDLDPALFDIPNRYDRDGWEQLRRTAEKWCARCPLMQVCAADPDSRHGLWGGSARWLTSTGSRVEVLVPGAPPPPRFEAPPPSFAEWVPPRKVVS